MKKAVFFALLCLISATALFAQPKSQRRIYLWDVTLSMKGFGGTPNIYDDVVKFLEKEIESITDESTEVVVLPFQERILEVWNTNADMTGKKEIIKKIKNYSNHQSTYTNIVGPLKDIMSTIISCDKNNILMILTDGLQSKQFGGCQELINWIDAWGEYSKENCAYALYVMLTKEANDQKVRDKIKKTANIDVILEIKNPIDIIDLHPAELIKINIEEKTAEIYFTYNHNKILPENIKIQITAVDSILNINQTVAVRDSKIKFDVNYQSEYQVFQTRKTQLAETTILPINMKLMNQDEIKVQTEKILFLTRENIELELINKPEKILRISIKQ